MGSLSIFGEHGANSEIYYDFSRLCIDRIVCKMLSDIFNVRRQRSV